MTSFSEFEIMISQALDHELSDAEMAELQAHLAHCAKCRTLYDDLLQIQTATTSLSRPAPETLHAHIMSRIQEDVTLNAPDNKPPIPRKKSHVKWYLTAAVFLLLISVSFFYKLHGIPGQENLLSADSKKEDALTESSSEAKQKNRLQQDSTLAPSPDQEDIQTPAFETGAITADEAEKILLDYLNIMDEHSIVIYYKGVSKNNTYYLFTYTDPSGQIWNYQVSSIDKTVIPLP